MNIRLENVNYIYNPGTIYEKTALRDINVTIGGDEFIAVIGSTGSGKSTFAQLLNGLIAPTSGKILFDGEEIHGKKDEKVLLRELRCKVGLTFQYPEYQLFEKDVITDVSFGPKNLGLDKEAAEERAKKALTSVGIGEAYHKKSPFELSGGEMRRVAIAGMLAMEPEVLILDEPTAGLDPAGKNEILDMLRDVRKERNLTVVLVSHTMEEVAKYCERVIAISDSHILYDLPVHEMFSKYKELEEIGLKAPNVMYITEALKEAGLDLDTNTITIEEARDSILKALKR